MGIKDKIASIIPFIKQEENRLNVSPIWRQYHRDWRDWSGERAIQEGLKQNVWVYACIRKIAESVASVPWHVKEVDGDIIENHPVEQLLTNPNPNPLITGNTLLKLEVNHRQLAGNAIWYKNIVGNQVVELWPLKPDKVHPLINPDGMIRVYEYETPEGKRVEVDPEHIIHFIFANPADFYWGISPLQAAAKTVDTDVTALKHNYSILGNAGQASGVLTYNHDLNEEQWQEARERVKHHQKNPGDWWVVGNDAEVNSLTMSIEEMQLHELRKMSMYEIHAAFDVDPLLTGAPDPASRANKEEAKREFWQNNIIPYLESLKEGLENNLLVHWDESYLEPGEEPTLKMEYDLSNVEALRDDLVSKAQVAQQFYDMGVPFNKINERLELGFDDVPGGDTPRGSLEMASRKPPRKKDLLVSEREIRWKEVEEDREAWEEQVTPVIEEEFEREAELIEEYLEGTTDIDIEEIEEILDARVEEWQVMMENIYIPVIQHFGQEELERLEGEKSRTKAEFDEFEDRVTEWMSENAAEQATLITQASKNEVRRIVTEGRREGLSMTEIGRNIRDTYNIWTEPDEEREFYRAMRIARTEVQMAQGKGSFEGAVQAEEEFGIEIEKTWITTIDGRERPAHADLNNETRPLREKYPNGLMHPGDPSGPPEEIIQCRCAETHRPVS